MHVKPYISHGLCRKEEAAKACYGDSFSGQMSQDYESSNDMERAASLAAAAYTIKKMEESNHKKNKKRPEPSKNKPESRKDTRLPMQETDKESEHLSDKQPINDGGINTQKRTEPFANTATEKAENNIDTDNKSVTLRDELTKKPESHPPPEPGQESKNTNNTAPSTKNKRTYANIPWRRQWKFASSNQHNRNPESHSGLKSKQEPVNTIHSTPPKQNTQVHADKKSCCSRDLFRKQPRLGVRTKNPKGNPPLKNEEESQNTTKLASDDNEPDSIYDVQTNKPKSHPTNKPEPPGVTIPKTQPTEIKQGSVRPGTKEKGAWRAAKIHNRYEKAREKLIALERIKSAKAIIELDVFESQLEKRKVKGSKNFRKDMTELDIRKIEGLIKFRKDMTELNRRKKEGLEKFHKDLEKIENYTYTRRRKMDKQYKDELKEKDSVRCFC